MKTRAIVITLVIVLLTAAAYIGRQLFVDTQQQSLWDLVPASALAIYQTGTCSPCVDSIVQSPYNKLFAACALQNGLDELSAGNYLQLMNGKEMITVHKTAKSRFDFVYYVRKDVAERSLSELQTSLGEGGAITKSKRNFNGAILEDVTLGGVRLTWTDIGVYRVTSINPILVEDVVRASLTKEKGIILGGFDKVIGLPTVKNDGGNIFIRTQELSNWVSIFSNDQNRLSIDLGYASVLDVKAAEDAIVLSGFTGVDSVNRNSLLSLFREQSPVQFDLRRLVSNNAKTVASYGFSNSAALGKRLQTMIESGKRVQLMTSLRLTQEKLELLYGQLDQEVVVLQIESVGQTVPVVMIELKGTSDWVSFFDEVDSRDPSDSTRIEKFSDYLIAKAGRPEIVELLLPVIVNKLDDLHYTLVGNVLMLAEDAETIKTVLDDIDEENTWGKSLDKNKFLESTLLESNVSFYADASEIANWANGKMNNEWRAFTKRYSQLVTRLYMCAFQFSNLNESFYTTIHLGYLPSRVLQNKKNRIEEVFTNLDEGIATKPFIVKNHTNKLWEVMLQDSAHNVSLISREGKVLWRAKLDGALQDEVKQVDFYLNGKLQYLLSTQKRLYIIDRLGNMVDSYPRELGFTNEYLGLIDYDHSRNYRFMVSDKKGIVRMFDKSGNLLEGWAGLETKGELLVAPRHYRVASKDYIAVAHKEGKFTLYNRRGEIVRGFPVDLKGKIRDDFYLQRGSKGEDPYFVFATTDGYRVKVDLSGRELSREPLLKQSVDAYFRLIQETSGKSYVVVRQDMKSLVVMNEDLQEIIKNDFIGLNSTNVQCYSFGAGKGYVTLTDTQQDLCYVYSMEGGLLTKEPVVCNSISLVMNGNELQAVTTYGKLLRMLTLH